MKTTIILAGGLGTRLKSVIQDMPKPMAPVRGKPFCGVCIAISESLWNRKNHFFNRISRRSNSRIFWK